MDSLECVSSLQPLHFALSLATYIRNGTYPSKPGTVGGRGEKTSSSCFCSFSCCMEKWEPGLISSSQGPRLQETKKTKLQHSASWILKLPWKQNLLQPKQVHCMRGGVPCWFICSFINALETVLCRGWTWEPLTFRNFWSSRRDETCSGSRPAVVGFPWEEQADGFAA